MPAPVEIRPLTSDDHAWVSDFVVRHWGADLMVAHGVQYRLSTLPGFCAMSEGAPVGLITFHLDCRECEVVSLDSLREGEGIGSALIEAVIHVARQRGCRRLWLVTTNDNLHALHFYQKRGFTLVAVHRNAVEASRRIKPEIPFVGNDGIPMRDEIELEVILARGC